LSVLNKSLSRTIYHGWRAFLPHSLYSVFVVAYLGAIVAIYLANPFFVDALRLVAFDSYQRIAPLKKDPKLPVAIVDIDQHSLETIGQWPWPRTKLAELLDKLRGDGAAVVAFDAMFAEPDRTSLEQIQKGLPASRASQLAPLVSQWKPNDEVFADAIKAMPSVLAMSMISDSSANQVVPTKAGIAVAGDDPKPFLHGSNNFVENLPILTQAAAGLGMINWFPDRDGVIRRVPLIFRIHDKIVPSLAAEALRVAQGASTFVIKSSNANGETAYGNASGINHVRIGALEIPTDPDGGVWLRYRPSDLASFIPAWKVLSDKVSHQAIEGRIILIGTSASGLVDTRSTPLDANVAGVEIHEQIIEHLLSGQFLTRPDWAPAVELLILVFFGIGLAVLFPNVGSGHAAQVGGGVILALNLTGWLLYRYEGLLLDTLYPSATLLLLVIGSAFYLYRRTEVQRAEMKRAFGQYVSPAVVAQLAANPEKLVLGGEERELTMLFSDIRNWSTISEGMNATELTTFINELLTPMSDVIMGNAGTIDKYMGDAVVAFWNAPLDDADHVRHALDAACAMKKELARLNTHWKSRAVHQGKPWHEVAIGIGVNTGTCCVGNLGSQQRFDYSAIGDEMNIASRFEGLTKHYGVPLITSEATANAAPDFRFLELDLVRVKGRGAASRIFTLLRLLDLPEEHVEAVVAAQNELLANFRTGDWHAAEAALEKGRALANKALGKVYSLYEERIAQLKHQELPTGWDGVHTMAEK
jgi:adenylate cyclase